MRKRIIVILMMFFSFFSVMNYVRADDIFGNKSETEIDNDKFDFTADDEDDVDSKVGTEEKLNEQLKS